jgi:transcriptional regulator with XRE-family HTH domain
MPTSSSLSMDKRRRTYVRMIGQIHDALMQALCEEQEKRGLTQTGMADALNTNKSFISRKMNGSSNMTLETLADLAFALDRIVEVNLRSRAPAPDF